MANRLAARPALDHLIATTFPSFVTTVRPWPFGTVVRTTAEAGGVPSKAVIVVDPGGNDRLTKPRGLVVSDDRIDDVEILDPRYWEPDV